MRSRWKGVPSLLGDVGLRLAAVALAILVVLLSRPGARREAVLPVPLRITGLSDSLIVSTSLPARVDVRVQGPAGALMRLRLSPPELLLDLSGLQPGEVRERELRPGDVRLAPRAGARVIAVVSPRFVPVGVDRELDAMLPVEVVWGGTLTAGRTLGAAPTLTPRDVRVVGPARLVGPLTSIRTEPIDLSQERSSQPFSVRLALPADPVRVTPDEITARVLLDPVAEETFRDLPVVVLNNRLVAPAATTPGRVALTLRGPRSLLAHVRASRLSPRVDARNLLSGRHFLLVEAESPGPDLVVVRIDPDHIAVVLQ